MTAVATDDAFRDPRELRDPYGVVAEGGPIDAERLLAAYRRGIFPWCGDPVQWCCPNPRAIFARVKTPKRFGRVVRRGKFSVSYDCAFNQVMQACAETHAELDEGTWISDAFIAGYAELHDRGHARSVEVWQGDALVGGLYGVQVGGLFSGESMFHRVDNASKVAFVALIYQLRAIGTILLDGQVLNPHTHRLGAVPMRRTDYLTLLEHALACESQFDGVAWPAGGPAAALGHAQPPIPLAEHVRR